MTNQETELLTEPQAAARLGVSRLTLYRLRKRRGIKFYRVGVRGVRYAPDHLRDYLASVEKEIEAVSA